MSSLSLSHSSLSMILILTIIAISHRYDNVDKADDGTESLAIATETTDANGRTPFETRVVKKIASVPTSERIRDWDLHVVLFESLIPGDFAKTYIDGANDIISTLASNQLLHISEKIHGLQFENNGSYVNRHLSIESYGWYGFVFLLGDDTLIQTIEFVGPIENATLRNERSDVEPVPTNNASDNNNNIVLIAVAVSSALVLVLIIVGVFSWHKVRKVNKEHAEGKMKMELMQLDVKRFQNAWRLDWDQVKLLEKIGQGGAGEVFRGLINQSIPAAIKIMKNSDMKNDMENREIQVLMRIRHKRLVHFLGYGENPEGGIFVGLEMCEFSLDTFCRGGEDTENAKKYMSWPARLQIASDIAEGCTHLHQSGLIHRDLKSGNVLLNCDDKHVLRGKVADFGLSKIFESKSDSTSSSSSETFNSGDDTKQQDQDPDSSSLQKDTSWSSTSSSHTTGVGSLFWMAPELVVALREDRGVYTPKVDVYAFGIIMHELLTLLRPYSDRNVTFSYKILNAVEKGERPLVGPHTRAKAPETYCDLMETCWHQDAQKRPEFKTVFLRLCKMHSTLLKCSSTRSDKESHIDGDV